MENKESKTMDLEEKINKLENALNEEKNKNCALVENNNKLNIKIEEIVKSNQQKDLVNRINNSSAKKQIKELNDKLNEANKIIENQDLKIKELENIISNLKNNNEYINKLQNLEKEIKIKDNELNKLKNELKNNNKTQNIVNVDRSEMMAVYFHHQKYNYCVACINQDLFAEVEEKFYKQFPELRNTNNVYLVDGNEVLRFKTIEENKIKNSYPVLLQIPDNK